VSQGKLPRTDQHGETLLEVLITVMVVGVGVTGLLFGLLSAASGSGASQSYADVRQGLAAAAERVQAAHYQPGGGTGLANCSVAPTSAYTAALAAITPAKNGDGSDAASKPTVARIDFWTGSTFLAGSTVITDPTDNSGTVPGCFYDRAPGSSHMQRITLQSGSEKLTFVKREP
jgi:prepilin-type N-terminal cleavage/methylation domain-containing protein